MGRVTHVQRHRAGVRLAVRPTAWPHVPAVGDSISVSGCCLTVAAAVVPNDPAFVFDMVPETLSRTRLGDLRPDHTVNLEHAATMATFLGGHLVQGHVDGLAEVVAVSRPRALRVRGGRPARRSQPDAAGEWRVRFSVPWPHDRQSDPSAGDLMQYIVPKGSICVDGVSLTIAALWDEQDDTLLEHSGRAGAKRRNAAKTGESRSTGVLRLPRVAVARRGFEVALIPETLRKTTLGKLRAGDRINLEVDSIAKTVVNWMRWHASAQSALGVSQPGRTRE